MPEKRVFLFGAGASKAEGGLLTSELLYESLETPGVALGFVSIVKRFLNELFRVPEGQSEKLPQFEELLTLVDVALLKNEEFSEYWNNMRLMELREALVYCIGRILKLKLQSQPENPIPEYHKQFIRSIFGESENTDRARTEPYENSFISLNYDILLDYALLELYPRWDIDYGNSFSNFHAPREGRGIKLLKLHGSLNWAFCPVCNSMKLSLHGKIADRIIAERIRCQQDQAVQRPLIIPPTWLKVYDNAYLTKIWLEAEHILRTAEAVFFIGYSLPESDVHVRYLLKKSLYRQGTYPRIVVITSKERRKKSAIELRSRYERFFGPIEIYHIGFEKFSSDVRKYV
jgi:hypothetical protein